MPVDPQDLRNVEGTPQTAVTHEVLRVRCPHCRKLYLVQYADIEEAKPRFECVQCHQRFWLAMGDMDFAREVDGLPLQVREAPKPVQREMPTKAQEPCPKCFKSNPVGASDCAHCGVVIEKARTQLDFKESSVPAHSPHLDMLWKKLIADYPNQELHNGFLRACQKEQNLAYAGAQYAQMRKLMPSDEITLQKLKDVQTLGAAILPPPVKSQVEPYPPYGRVWLIPLIGAVILILFGFSVASFRNMAGVGAAFLFFALTLKWQLRRR